MPIDLAISSNGDLIFGGNRDLMIVSRRDLVEQRIRLRLKIPRGSWIYDKNKTLGSELHRALRSGSQDAMAMVTALVSQAIRPMGDITIADTRVTQGETERDLSIEIAYTHIVNVEDVGKIEPPPPFIMSVSGVD